MFTSAWLRYEVENTRCENADMGINNKNERRYFMVLDCETKNRHIFLIGKSERYTPANKQSLKIIK